MRLWALPLPAIKIVWHPHLVYPGTVCTTPGRVRCRHLIFITRLAGTGVTKTKDCYQPGEIGKIIGLDRVPEVRCLREKIHLLTNQQQAQHLNRLLINDWYQNASEEPSFLYIDGHTRIYYGHKANLPTKSISRQKLCLHATTEYWVNDAKGLPVLMVTGELTEKLQQAIEQYIIPQLHQTAIITTNTIITTEKAAGRMFGRWSQENFFRYMIMDYDFDKMIQFGTEAIDENKEIVNPIYRQTSHKLNKEKEKTARPKAKLYPLTEQSIANTLDDIPALIAKKATLLEQIEQQEK